MPDTADRRTGNWRPLPPEAVPEVIAELLLDCRPGHPLRVAMDGPEPWDLELMTRLTGQWLAAAGRPTTRVQTRHFLRPRSLRYEHGRTDPDSYYDWLDDAGLRRELLDPLGPDGSQHFLSSLWDPVTDRATRADYEHARPDAVILVDGPLLLGRGLPFDVTVHVHVGPAALARRIPEDESWTLPAFDRYAEAVRPGDVADIVIRNDDQRHPALLSRLALH